MNKTRHNFIVSPIYDWVHIIGTPLMALLLAIPFSQLDVLKQVSFFSVDNKDLGTALIGMFIMSHLFIVFFRSHLNTDIFKLYPARFIWIPLAMLLLAMSSLWMAIIFSVLATWWDVYHSSLQTFGFGRIYDSKRGNGQNTGRRIDYFFNLLMYVGPILAGQSLMAHMNDFSEFSQVDALFLQNIPLHVYGFRHELQSVVLWVGGIFMVGYVAAYYVLYLQGYVFAWQKIVLYLLTACVSVAAWGFNSFGEAFFIMNFFHAWQYFAIVWAKEGKNMRASFGIKHSFIMLMVFLFLGLGYGVLTEHMPTAPALFAITITVSLLHFWYDGFVWSVKKAQV